MAVSVSAIIGDESALLAAARAGDRDAFVALFAPHQRALHVHCYRMLGSLDDADDAMQEVQLLAWRGLSGFAGRAPLRHWLYRIATTTCLKVIRARPGIPVAASDLVYLQPYPDRLLDQLAVADGDPAVMAEQRDNIALAIITAVQLLPATQRAALLLRDVLAFTPAETADLLGTTVPAANSLLQRARTTMTGHGHTGRTARTLDATDRQVVQRFIDAWHRRDIDALAGLLAQDAVLRMPPERAEFRGRTGIIDFLSTVPAGGRLDLIKLVQVEANGQLAVAAYLPDHDGECRGYGIMVLDTTDGTITTITGFPNADLFPRFGLPMHRAAG